MYWLKSTSCPLTCDTVFTKALKVVFVTHYAKLRVSHFKCVILFFFFLGQCSVRWVCVPCLCPWHLWGDSLSSLPDSEPGCYSGSFRALCHSSRQVGSWWPPSLPAHPYALCLNVKFQLQTCLFNIYKWETDSFMTSCLGCVTTAPNT